GVPATAFVTILHAGPPGSTSVLDVAPRVATSVAAGFNFQTTDPATNAVTGTPNRGADIGPGVGQTFVIALTPTAAVTPTDVTFEFAGPNADVAQTIGGVNTLLLSSSATPIPDIVALAATIGKNGIVDIPGATGTGVFAVATVNVGASGNITASAD